MYLNKVCRICLLKKFDTEDIFSMADVIKTIAPIQLDKEDGLPSIICTDCSLQANQAYNFIQLCIKSDDTLRQQLLSLVLIKEEKHDCVNDDISMHSDNFKENLEILSEINEAAKKIDNRVVEHDLNENKKSYMSDNDSLALISSTKSKEDKMKYKINSKFHLLVKKLNTTVVTLNKNAEKFNVMNDHDYGRKLLNKSEEYKMNVIVNRIGMDELLRSSKSKKKKINANTTSRPFLLSKINTGVTHDMNTKNSDSINNDNEDDVDKLLNDMSEENRINMRLRLYCRICDKQFEVLQEFRKHLKKHKENLECPICKKRYPTYKRCWQHMRMHKKGIYLCETCGKLFKRMEELTMHQRRHVGAKLYKCKICNKSFMSSNQVSMHMRSHTTEQNCLCNICGHKYKSKAQLLYHIKHKHMMAQDERPHVCHCGKTFKVKHILTAHQRDVHTTERKHLCKLCNMGFKTASTLRQHEKVHKGEKPFICIVCEKSFVSKGVLNRHIKNKHKRMPENVGLSK